MARKNDEARKKVSFRRACEVQMSDKGASVLLLIDKVPLDDKAACTIFLLIYFKVDRIVGQEEFLSLIHI